MDIPALVLHMVGMRVCAKFRHRTTRRLGEDRPRQNKQTLKYLVDILHIGLLTHSVSMYVIYYL